MYGWYKFGPGCLGRYEGLLQVWPDFGFNRFEVDDVHGWAISLTGYAGFCIRLSLTGFMVLDHKA